MARDPDPIVRIPMESIGYQSPIPEFLMAGDSMLTLNFVGESHLLVTFTIRKLMKREENDPPGDQDRTVAAYLLELPSGKAVAHTEWRLHDRGQYLWALGEGRFLLRVRDQLTVLAPLAAASPADSFHGVPFVRDDGRLLAMTVSADADLLTIETVDRAAPGIGQWAGAGPGAPAASRIPVLIHFYRLSVAGTAAGERLVVTPAGVLRSPVALALPLTTAGFLDVLEGGRNRWLFNFDSHAGKVSELAEFHTTCYPHITFVSHSEFVAFGCRGGDDRQDIAGFNLKGDAMWQQSFFDTHTSPTFAFAPAAGRFALGRTIVGGGVSGTGVQISLAVMGAQEVRVYQTYSGKQVFRMDCSPVQIAGQNFAMSADGLQLAVIRETVVHHSATKEDEAYSTKTAAIEIYALPPLTSKDEAAVKEAQGLTPKDTGAAIDVALGRISGRGAAKAAVSPEAAPGTGSSGVPQAAAVPSAAALPPAPPTGVLQTPAGVAASSTAASAAGDPQETEPRKPPTLYGPDEKAGGKPK